MPESSAREPKYWLLKQHLLSMVDAMEPGTPIPTERALAGEYDVSRTTVRQALAELTVEGRLRRIQGKGTFVAEPKVAQPLQLSSYTEDMRAQGLTPSSRLISVSEETADATLAALLGIAEGDTALRLHRLRLANGEPMAIESTLLPLGRFPGLRAQLSGSLYEVLATHYQVTLGYAEETIETALASPADAEVLGADVGSPVLLLSRHSFDTKGRPVEWVRSIYRGDRYKFVTRLATPG